MKAKEALSRLRRLPSDILDAGGNTDWSRAAARSAALVMRETPNPQPSMIERPNCPLCDDPAQLIFSRSYRHPALLAMIERFGLREMVSDEAYEVRFCSGCDLYFQSWVLDDSEAAKPYVRGTGLEFFLEEIAQQKLRSFAHQTEEILVLRQLSASKRPMVLDFGCDWGKWASIALAHGCDVYAIEINRNAAAFCAARGIKVIDTDRLEELRFDFINADQVVEHLSKPATITRRLADSLKPGGFLKVSTPRNSRLPRLLGAAQRDNDDGVLSPEALDSLYPLVHVNLFSNRSLRALSVRVGLRVCHLPLFKWLGAGQLWNVPRQLNRNLTVPFKRWLGLGTYLWLQKPPNARE